MDYLLNFYQNPSERENGFAGQLTEDFQSRLARAHANLSLDQCTFYHTMEYGNHEVVEGVWDLRGGEPSYLGYVDCSGEKVLEFGPATGHISYYLEKQGADVVCFDLAPGLSQEIIPQVGHDLEEQKRQGTSYAEKIRNSWWYGHSRLNSGIKAVYGDIYHLPQDVGRYDVSTFGCILLHLSNPFYALKQAADRTDKAIIVTDTIGEIPDDQESAVMRFVPVDTHKESVVVWWSMSPGAVARMLNILGFIEVSVYYHVQKVFFHHDLSKPPVDQLLFTVVGERVRDRLGKIDRSESDLKAELDLIRKYSSGSKKTEQLEAEIRAMRSSLSWRITAPFRTTASVFKRLLHDP